MSKVDNKVLAGVIASLDAELAKPIHKPKRAYNKPTAETKERTFETRLMGYDPRYENHKPGRHKGGRNKPRDPSLPPIKRPRVHIDLDHTNAGEYFVMVNGLVYRRVGSQIGGLAMTRDQASRMFSKYHPYTVMFRKRRYLAADVAWWLQTREEIPDGMCVLVQSLAQPPTMEYGSAKCNIRLGYKDEPQY